MGALLQPGQHFCPHMLTLACPGFMTVANIKSEWRGPLLLGSSVLPLQKLQISKTDACPRVKEGESGEEPQTSTADALHLLPAR